MDFNRHELIGRVGKDPTVKTFDDGNEQVRFSIATSSSYTNKEGEKVEDTDWHNIVSYGKLAEICKKFVVKGSRVFAEGEHKMKTYEKEGEYKTISEIRLRSIILLDSKKPSEFSSEQKNSESEKYPF